MTLENIRDCDTCKHIEKSSDEYPCVACSSTEHYDSIYDMMPWIPCSERLPELGKYVLCMCRGNIQEVMRLTPDGWFHDHNHCYMGGFVIAWMPLPEPYKEGDKE